MTLACRLSRVSGHGSPWSRGWAVPCASLLLATPLQPLLAQPRGDAPIAPASAIGPATRAATWSVLGLAAANDVSSNSVSQRSDMWVGATQPLGGIGHVRFSAIGSGTMRMAGAAAGSEAGGGQLALRVRAEFDRLQLWSAVSYGYVRANGLASQATDVMRGFIAPGADAATVDTTISRHIDVGSVQRAEAGMLTSWAGLELSVGFAMDRATRVTTQTLTINEPSGVMAGGRMIAARTLRAVQRRDIASGIASLGFHTGPTSWLMSVTAPIAAWISSDGLSPRPTVAPAIASIAMVQPVTDWLSIVGAASTNRASVGSTALRDDLGADRGRRMAPVVAIGVRLARLPFLSRNDDTPSGILGFESRTIGTIDSTTVDASVERHGDPVATEQDSLRVILFIEAPKAESIEMMGDATAWTITRMTRVSKGRWRAELRLTPGVHRIAIRADRGKWMAPPSLPVGNDDYGTPVGMMVVNAGTKGR